jgi:hypothetical protein
MAYFCLLMQRLSLPMTTFRRPKQKIDSVPDTFPRVPARSDSGRTVIQPFEQCVRSILATPRVDNGGEPCDFLRPKE